MHGLCLYVLCACVGGPDVHTMSLCCFAPRWLEVVLQQLHNCICLCNTLRLGSGLHVRPLSSVHEARALHLVVHL